MKLQDDAIDFTTLNWVKQELDETLKQALETVRAGRSAVVNVQLAPVTTQRLAPDRA